MGRNELTAHKTNRSHIGQNSMVHVAFCPWMVAGVRTHWENLRPFVLERPDLRAYIIEVNPYKAGGLVESLPLLPSKVKGNMRNMMTSTALFRPARLDGVWLGDMRSAMPFLFTKGLLQHTLVFASTDGTGEQLSRFGGHYNVPANYSIAGRLRSALSKFLHRKATIMNPWSKWAAQSLIDDYGIPSHKIHVIPPGIELDRWPILVRRRSQDEPVRLLFVGADFERKGGDLLLDVFRQRLQDRCELHLVTRSNVTTQPGVHVYRDLSPNDPNLRNLYACCDIFVLPTRADCFSLASIEAMATGLPVITTAVGGIPEIVAEGRSGFLIAPDDGVTLAQRLETLVEAPELRAWMGHEGRRIAETRFDARCNATRLLDLMVNACRQQRDASVIGGPGRA